MVDLELVPACHRDVKHSEATFRASCVNVRDRGEGLWGDCPVCRSTLLLRRPFPNPIPAPLAATGTR